jgi:hypothetical protein
VQEGVALTLTLTLTLIGWQHVHEGVEEVLGEMFHEDCDCIELHEWLHFLEAPWSEILDPTGYCLRQILLLEADPTAVIMGGLRWLYLERRALVSRASLSLVARPVPAVCPAPGPLSPSGIQDKCNDMHDREEGSGDVWFAATMDRLLENLKVGVRVGLVVGDP